MNHECRTVLFPGSFDPFTLGHADLVARGLQMFDTLVIVVGYNMHKLGWIAVDERVRALQTYYKDEPRVTVVKHDGLTTMLAQQLGARHILRGVRSVQDYEYEMQMADVNHNLTGVETVLLPARPQLSSVSSSVVRELAHFGQQWKQLLPEGLDYEAIPK